MASLRERRQRIRHKLHTPVYASFSGPRHGMVLDLSELVDVHEDGFAVQTADPLEPSRAVNVCLDLPETKNYIHGTGHVVWSNAEGRAGIRFSGLAEQPRRLLREWLFVNLLIAAANHDARSEQLVQLDAEPPPEPEKTASQSESFQVPPPGPVADLTSLLSAVDAVHRELRSHELGFHSKLQLLTERTASLTGATGAALALLSDGPMVCRASAGEPAPPLQSVVDVQQGFSGDCVRNARTTVCEDSETDPRVDREICRVLGIRSIMATPVVSDFRVVGLLEVLSPHPRAFAKIHEIVLERLAELVPNLDPSPQMPPSDSGTPISTLAQKSEAENQVAQEESNPETPVQRLSGEVSVGWGRLGLLVAAVAFAALSLGYFLAPVIERHWLIKPETLVQAAAPAAMGQQARAPLGLDELRRRAEQGDAEAQWDLGSRYHHGEGVPQNDTVAVNWFQRAAEQGSAPAQGALGAYYWAGRGVPQDLSKAYFWSALALAQGDETSKSRLEGLASQMTRSQIAAARQQAEDWIRQHSSSARTN